MLGLNSRAERFKIFALSAFIIAALCAGIYAFFISKTGVLEVYREGVGEDAPSFHSRHTRGVSFKNYAGKVNRIVHYYIKADFPPPENFPSHTIEWRAFLNAPEHGHYGFRVDSSHPVEFQLNGEVLLSEPGEVFLPLSGGANEFVLKFFNDDGERGRNTTNRQLGRGSTNRGVPTGSLKLLWKPPESPAWEAVPGGVFSRGCGSAGLINLGVFAFLLLAGGLIFTEPAFYRDFLARNRAGIAIACIAALGFALRFYQHGIIPVYIETWDEIGAGWSGWSLINRGVPVSWSKLFEAYGYGRPAVSWFGTNFNIVAHYFDHPPLFHLVAGAAAIAGGAREMLQVSVSDMRIVPVVFSSSVTVLLYLILKDHYSRRAALLASFMYAVVPTIVVSGRLVEEDNMMLVLVMLALLFYSRNLDKQEWKAAAPVALFTGLAALSKFTAVSFIGAFSALYLMRGRWKQALTVFGLGGGIAVLAFAYGALIDWEMFLRVFSEQGGKISQFAMPVRLIFSPKLIDSVFWDGGVLFLWLSAPALVILKKGEFSRDMGVLFAVYFILISVNVVMDYGWYAIMMFPFLCAGGGLLLDELIRSRSVLLMAFFTGIAVMLNLQAVLSSSALLDPGLPLITAGVFLAPLVLSHILKNRKWENIALAVILIALFAYALTSVIMVINFADIYYGAPRWVRALRV